MSAVDPVQAVADALDRHKYEAHGVCACGLDLEAKWGTYKVAWRKHIAPIMAEVAAVAALREAADALDAEGWPTHQEDGGYEASTRLRERADRIEGES